MKVSAGFTLIELMVTLMLAAILMAVGVPSYRYVTNSNRLSTEVNNLLGDMQYARSQAIKEGMAVTVCTSTNGTTCTAGSVNWHQGWIVLDTGNGTNTVQRMQPKFTNPNDTFTSDNAVAAVTFNRDGFAAGLPSTANGYVTITLHTVPNVSQWTRCLEVGMVGVLTTERSGTDNCK